MKKEREETLEHEIGHIWGLRHYFAPTDEADEKSVTFGVHRKETIMNYGENSHMTRQDKIDLERLYNAVWSGRVKEIDNMVVVLQNTNLSPSSEE